MESLRRQIPITKFTSASDNEPIETQTLAQSGLQQRTHTMENPQVSLVGPNPCGKALETDDGEMLTRPRLTPEQVTLLEDYFRMHPKPNTDVKRRLAQTTELSLARVAVSLTPLIAVPYVLIPGAELVSKSTSQSKTPKETGGI